MGKMTNFVERKWGNSSHRFNLTEEDLEASEDDDDSTYVIMVGETSCS